MKVLIFFNRQLLQVRKGGPRILVRKIKLSFILLMLKLPSYLLAIPFVLILRLIRPLFLVRMANLINSRIGHFVANTELYLCEQDAGINKPKQRYIDLFYLLQQPICNNQVLKMWNRELQILPRIILQPIDQINQLIPGGDLHVIKSIKSALDTKNLLDKYPSHLRFTLEEEDCGQ